jgi:hypothetical protein
MNIMTALQNDQKTGHKSPEGFACHNFGFRADENGEIDQKARENCVISKSHVHNFLEVNSLQERFWAHDPALLTAFLS